MDFFFCILKNKENENDDEEIDVTDEQTKFHQNAAIDFSNAIPHHYAQNILLPQQHAHHHLHQQQLLSHYQAAMAVAHQSLYRAGIHNFIDSAALDRPQLYPEFYQQHHTQSLAKSLYPKLHEDILHSSKPYAPSYPTSPFAENAFSKYPPLGNLCKTVSQIGQNSDIPAPSFSVKKAASPARTDISPIKKSLKRPASQMNSSADTSESASTPKQTAKSSRMDSMDSGMESSDDTKSETSSTKEESGKDMFPAWIYCTRYSDRPSSGRFLKTIITLFKCGLRPANGAFPSLFNHVYLSDFCFCFSASQGPDTENQKYRKSKVTTMKNAPEPLSRPSSWLA